MKLRVGLLLIKKLAFFYIELKKLNESKKIGWRLALEKNARLRFERRLIFGCSHAWNNHFLVFFFGVSRILLTFQNYFLTSNFHDKLRVNWKNQIYGSQLVLEFFFWRKKIQSKYYNDLKFYVVCISQKRFFNM